MSSGGSHLSRGFHYPFRRSHLPLEAVRVTEALMRAVKVERVDQLGHRLQPRHVRLQLVVLVRNVEERRFRLVFLRLVGLVAEEAAGFRLEERRVGVLVVGGVRGRDRADLPLRRSARVGALEG